MDGISTLLDFDELNRIYESTSRSEYDMQKILEAAYILGCRYAFSQLYGREPDEDEIDDIVDVSLLNDTVWKKTDGKTFADRMDERQQRGEGGERMRVVLETEYHRIFDTSSHHAAEAISKRDGRHVIKTWHTQLDDRVRDTHDYMQGQEKPLEEDFYTYNGDHAPTPGQFGVAEEDINCRCYLTYSFDSKQEDTGMMPDVRGNGHKNNA